MADQETKKVETEQEKHTALDAVSVQEAPVAVLGEGSVDPVYEAKARVLNSKIPSQVMWSSQTDSIQLGRGNSRYRHGQIPMATLHRGWFWMGNGTRFSQNIITKANSDFDFAHLGQSLANCNVSYLHSSEE